MRSYARRAALLAVGLLAACSANQDPDGATALWERLQAMDYRSLPRPPGFEVRRPSTGVHAADVDLYVSEALATLLAGSQAITEWPAGSLIVKDGWTGPDLKIVAVMDKRSDGWYFAEYGPDGDVKASGRPGTCAGCHRTGDDFVRSFSFPR